MSWLQAQVTVAKDQAHLVELLFENQGALSISLTDAADEPMLEPPLGSMPLWQAICVTGLFSGDVGPDSLRTALDRGLEKTPTSKPVRLDTVADQDWERVWLERFRPMQFGRRLWIAPTAYSVGVANAIVVRLDPGLAFGTGAHPTTALCLRWLDAARLNGKRVIDFGCGSGILAIAAARLGAAAAVGIDYDPQAIVATRNNAALNNVEDRVTAVLSSESITEFKSQSADIVIANILANVLIEQRENLTKLVAPGGQLVLSGILRHQMKDVLNSFGQQFDLAVAQQGEWVRLAGNRYLSS